MGRRLKQKGVSPFSKRFSLQITVGAAVRTISTIRSADTATVEQAWPAVFSASAFQYRRAVSEAPGGMHEKGTGAPPETPNQQWCTFFFFFFFFFSAL